MEFEVRYLDTLGIYPSQYVFYKSLVGDYADNIKGIKGIGPVTARRIINREMDFDELEHQSVIELNKKLIKLNSQVLVTNCQKLSINLEMLNLQNKQIFELCDF